MKFGEMVKNYLLVVVPRGHSILLLPATLVDQ